MKYYVIFCRVMLYQIMSYCSLRHTVDVVLYRRVDILLCSEVMFASYRVITYYSLHTLEMSCYAVL
jgi:hypothetical protein